MVCPSSPHPKHMRLPCLEPLGVPWLAWLSLSFWWFLPPPLFLFELLLSLPTVVKWAASVSLGLVGLDGLLGLWC